MERIKLNKEQYDLLMSKYLFNEKKNEKLILEMSLKGYTIKDISNIVNVSERTIYRRLNVLINKIDYFLNENDMLKNNYYVYIHTFPNNKVYIGITNDLKQRWKSGLGYQENRNRYGASEETDKSFHYMIKALEDFIMVLQEEAETPQQKQELMQALQKSMK